VLGTGCLAEYIEIRGMKLQEAGENYNEGLYNLYSSPYITAIIKSRKARWAGHVLRMSYENAYKILVGKPKGKRKLGRYRRRQEDFIKMGHKDIEW
jgi:hypothetical protein